MFRRPRTRYFNRNLVSHPTLSCSTSEHAHWNLSIRCKKKHGNSLRSHPIHRIVSNRYAMPPPPSSLPTYRSKLVFLYSLPDRVGGQLDSGVSSGRRVHQRHHPRDRRGVVEGQWREGDRNSVRHLPGIAFDHDPGGQVAALRTYLYVKESVIGAPRNLFSGPSPIVLVRERAWCARSGFELWEKSVWDELSSGSNPLKNRSWPLLVSPIPGSEWSPWSPLWHCVNCVRGFLLLPPF